MERQFSQRKETMTNQTKQAELPEEKLNKLFPDLAEAMLAHSFKADMGPDEDGSKLIGYVMPLGWVVEWLKIIQSQAQQEAMVRVESLRKTDVFPQSLTTYDGKTETFDRLSDNDIAYNRALGDVLEALQKEQEARE